MDSNKTAGEEARRQLHKNAASNLEPVLAAIPHKTPTVRLAACLLLRKLLNLDEPDMQDTQDINISIKFQRKLKPPVFC